MSLRHGTYAFELVRTIRYQRFLYPNTGSHKGKKAQFKEHKVFNSSSTLNWILLRD